MEGRLGGSGEKEGEKDRQQGMGRKSCIEKDKDRKVRDTETDKWKSKDKLQRLHLAWCWVGALG